MHFSFTNTCHRHKSPSLIKCHGLQSTLPSNIAWEPGLVHVMCRQHLSEVSFSEPLAVTNHALGVPTVTRPCFIDRRSSHTARREKGSRPLVGSSKTTSRDPPRKAMPCGPVGALQKFQEVYPYRLPTKLYCSFQTHQKEGSRNMMLPFPQTLWMWRPIKHMKIALGNKIRSCSWNLCARVDDKLGRGT